MDYADIDPPRGRASRSPSVTRARSRSPVAAGGWGGSPRPNEVKAVGAGSSSPRRDGSAVRRSRSPGRGSARPSQAPENPPASKVVGVFGLSIRTIERDLHETFDAVAPVEKVVIVYDARTGRSRGFGFVTMKDTEAAEAVIKKLNGIDLHGRRLRVDFSVTKRPHDPTPGEYRGNPRPEDDLPPRGYGGGYAPPPPGYGTYRGGAGFGGPPGGGYGGFGAGGYGPPPPSPYGPPPRGGYDRGPYDRAPLPRYAGRDRGPDQSDDWRRRPSPLRDSYRRDDRDSYRRDDRRDSRDRRERSPARRGERSPPPRRAFRDESRSPIPPPRRDVDAPRRRSRDSPPPTPRD